MNKETITSYIVYVLLFIVVLFFLEPFYWGPSLSSLKAIGCSRSGLGPGSDYKSKEDRYIELLRRFGFLLRNYEDYVSSPEESLILINFRRSPYYESKYDAIFNDLWSLQIQDPKDQPENINLIKKRKFQEFYVEICSDH